MKGPTVLPDSLPVHVAPAPIVRIVRPSEQPLDGEPRLDGRSAARLDGTYQLFAWVGNSAPKKSAQLRLIFSSPKTKLITFTGGNINKTARKLNSEYGKR